MQRKMKDTSLQSMSYFWGDMYIALYSTYAIAKMSYEMQPIVIPGFWQGRQE